MMVSRYGAYRPLTDVVLRLIKHPRHNVGVSTPLCCHVASMDASPQPGRRFLCIPNDFGGGKPR